MTSERNSNKLGNFLDLKWKRVSKNLLRNAERKICKYCTQIKNFLNYFILDDKVGKIMFPC